MLKSERLSVMRSLWPQLAGWLDAAEPFALATVERVQGSAPRVPGACMVIIPDQQRFLGSVSSGCLDAEIVEAAQAALRTGAVQRLRFGPDGQPPWSDGLTCGGFVDVRIEPWWAFHPRDGVRLVASVVRHWLEADEPGVMLSNDEGHVAVDAAGATIGDADMFDGALVAQARSHLERELPPACLEREGKRILVRTVRRRPRLTLVGAIDVAAHMIAPARAAGFTTAVVDPRGAYAVPERFVVAPDEMVHAWPQSVISNWKLGPRDAAVVLTHDPKIDDPALVTLLQTRVGYVGAMGSKRSHIRRLERLRDIVPSVEELSRIVGPAGIHLGTPDAAGIALGVLAGILQWQAQTERERLQVALSADTVT
jgi:xanthine dehydrogenase accessory factor